VRPSLFYINYEVVIPGKAGIQFINTGFRVKPGMTIEARGLLTQRTSLFLPRSIDGGSKIERIELPFAEFIL
jgi:hypothetical protein